MGSSCTGDAGSIPGSAGRGSTAVAGADQGSSRAEVELTGLTAILGIVATEEYAHEAVTFGEPTAAGAPQGGQHLDRVWFLVERWTASRSASDLVVRIDADERLRHLPVGGAAHRREVRRRRWLGLFLATSPVDASPEPEPWPRA